MVSILCPKCKLGRLLIRVKDGYEVSLDLAKANQKIICPVCKRRIQYSVQEKEIR